MSALGRDMKGMTLTEIMVSLAIFIVLIAIMYPVFSFLRTQHDFIGDLDSLYSKGQRVLDYMSEDLRLAGFLLGPDARVPYCTSGAVPVTPNTIVHVPGNPFDSLTFLTAMPVNLEMTAGCLNGQTDCNGQTRKDYALTTSCEAPQGANAIRVDAPESCVDIAASSGNNNGKSLVTFETLAPLEIGVSGNASQVYYSVTGTGSTLAITPALRYAIPDNSTVYLVRQYRYFVDTNNGMRTLVRGGWGKDCSTGGTRSELIETNATNPASGGIDGLKFEFVYENPVTRQLVTRATLPATAQEWTDWKFSQMKSIKIWILLRADVADKYYQNTDSYTLGEAAQTKLGPYGDNYRRLLLTKTVEVKNLALRSE